MHSFSAVNTSTSPKKNNKKKKNVILNYMLKNDQDSKLVYFDSFFKNSVL